MNTCSAMDTHIYSPCVFLLERLTAFFFFIFFFNPKGVPAPTLVEGRTGRDEENCTCLYARLEIMVFWLHSLCVLTFWVKGQTKFNTLCS